jgi:hypothetical protein
MQPIIRYTDQYVQELERIKAKEERELEFHHKRMDREQAEIDRTLRSSPPETAAEKFQRSIKRDPSQFKTFQNDLYWDTWFRGFTATSKTQGLDNVLNKAYVPINQSECDLFDSQKNYLYSVLIDRLQTENALAILKEHEKDKDSQKIIAEVVNYYENSAMAKNRASTLFSQITSTRIHSTRWNGTMRNFILNWTDKIREYRRLSGPSNHINDSTKKAILVNLVKPDPKLNDVIIRDLQRQRDGEREYPYEIFLEHILQTADIIDGAIGSTRKTASVNVHQQYAALEHEWYSEEDIDPTSFYDQDDNYYDEGRYTLNVARNSKRREFGPTLDKATWVSLDKDDQRAWNAVSPDGRMKMSKFFNKTGKESLKKTISPSSNQKFKSTSVKKLEQEHEFRMMILPYIMRPKKQMRRFN